MEPDYANLSPGAKRGGADQTREFLPHHNHHLSLLTYSSIVAPLIHIQYLQILYNSNFNEMLKSAPITNQASLTLR